MKFENKFDNIFRQKSKEIRIKPSQNVWQGIDSELSKRKRTSVYSIVGIAASLLILVGFFGLYSTQSSIYENPNYHVQQMDTKSHDSYGSALMEWVEFNRHPEASR